MIELGTNERSLYVVAGPARSRTPTSLKFRNLLKQNLKERNYNVKAFFLTFFSVENIGVNALKKMAIEIRNGEEESK